MPPPSFSRSRIASGVRSSRAARSPPASCRNARSPVTSSVGLPLPAATPTAEETMPSMPLAPRFANTSTPFASPPA